MAYRGPTSLAGLLLLAACSSGGSEPTPGPSPTPTATPSPTPSPSPSPTPTPSTAALQAAIDASPVANLYVIVGTRAGIVYRYQKGSFPSTATASIASATKMLSGATILRLVEAGRMSLSDHPQKYLSYWTNDPADPRSQVTLQQLLSFTSGFNPLETDRGCISDGNTTIAACAREFYERGLDTAPGTAFSYGPAHLQIAGAMAEAASGQSFPSLFRQQVADPAGMSSRTAYSIPSTSNPRLSGGGVSTAEDYAAFLSAMLGGRLLTDLDTYVADRTAGLPVLASPDVTTSMGEWHYGLASWHECDDTPFSSRCATARLISSPGAFGWTPWIDFDRGYWGLIAMYEPIGGSQQGVALEQQLQPLINTYLGLP
ncbi:serine hydrolase domain-containing protein [Sphingomonas sp. OTU376]|uniref:serine hydrolase domain-containing protein n=1 Tax=Sphingomonas sp. OTU376 TaxID=3043863 RepID=UPI00313BD0D9